MKDEDFERKFGEEEREAARGRMEMLTICFLTAVFTAVIYIAFSFVMAMREG